MAVLQALVIFAWYWKFWKQVGGGVPVAVGGTVPVAAGVGLGALVTLQTCVITPVRPQHGVVVALGMGLTVTEPVRVGEGWLDAVCVGVGSGVTVPVMGGAVVVTRAVPVGVTVFGGRVAVGVLVGGVPVTVGVAVGGVPV